MSFSPSRETPMGNIDLTSTSSSEPLLNSSNLNIDLDHVNALLKVGAGQSTTVQMNDYFPSLSQKPGYILRRNYVRANGDFYIQQIIDPSPNSKSESAESTYRPENIEATHSRSPGAEYYDLHDIAKDPLTGEISYVDTWHMRNLNGNVTSIADSFVKQIDGKNDPSCKWPTASCLGRANFYLDGQKLVFGGHETVGKWESPKLTNFAPNVAAWVQYVAGGKLEYGPALGYNVWSRIVVLESYSDYTLPIAIDGNRRTYKNVIKVLHGHGAKYPGMKMHSCGKPPEKLSGLYWPEDHNSYYQVQWLAKDVGYVQTEIVYTQQLTDTNYNCSGSWNSDPKSWSSYLNKASIEKLSNGQVIDADFKVLTSQP
jgi:hypothetical protein